MADLLGVHWLGVELGRFGLKGLHEAPAELESIAGFLDGGPSSAGVPNGETGLRRSDGGVLGVCATERPELFGLVREEELMAVGSVLRRLAWPIAVGLAAATVVIGVEHVESVAEDAVLGIGIPAPRNPNAARQRRSSGEESPLLGSASTVSGLCPIAGPTEYVSPVQCAAYDAQKHINRRSIAIFAASHAEGRWFDPSRDHRSDYRGQRVENAFRRPADPPWQSAIWGQNGAKLASAPTVVNVVERVERCRDVVKFVVK